MHVISVCEEGWSLFDESCYKVFVNETLFTWYESEIHCNKYNDGHLVSIRDSREMMFVHLLLLDNGLEVSDGTYIGK